MFGLGVGELTIILMILVLLFGATKVPQLARSMGTAIKEFKASVRDDEEKPVDSTTHDAGGPTEEKPEHS